MNLNHTNYKYCENFSQEKPFTSGQIFNKFHNAVAKSTAEPENSTNLSLANTSTPNDRAFFVCCTRTPKGNNQTQIGFDVFPSNEFNQTNFCLVESLSMVACNGKGFALCCIPVIAVSQPVTRYRQKPENFLAVTSSKFSLELSAMLTYLFKAISRRDLSNTSKPINQMPVYTLRKQAESEQQARAFFAPFYVILEGGLVC